jgi:hypothetical protein
MLAEFNGKKYKIGFTYSDRGITYCRVIQIKNFGDNQIAILSGIGYAQCYAKDVFERKIGRKIALARALKGAGISRSERTLVWEQFIKQCKV